MSGLSKSQALINTIQDITELFDLGFFEVGIVADIKSVKMDMLYYRVFFILIVSNNALQVRLTQLVAATGATSSELDFMVSQGLHHPFAKIRIGLLEDEVERVIATAFQQKIRFVFFGVEMIQEEFKVVLTLGVVRIEAFELVPPQNTAPESSPKYTRGQVDWQGRDQ